MHDDEGGNGTGSYSAWNASVMNYDADQLMVGRVLPWDDADGGPSAGGRARWRQDYERNDRGLVTRITGIYDDGNGAGNPTWDTQITHNLAGWPITSTERKRTASGWENATDPLKYEYDQLGNQTLWSSNGAKRTIQRSFYRSGQLRVKCGRRTVGGDQEQVYSYRYDSSGGLRQVVDWMHREAPSDDDEVCQPAEQDDKDSLGVRSTDVERDKAGRPLKVNETWVGGKATHLQYVPGTPNLIGVVRTDDKDGDPDDGDAASVYEYDEQDRNVAVKVRDGVATTGAVDRQTDMAWWPSGDRRETKKPKTTSDARTVEERFYDSRGQLTTRVVDPASGATKTHGYEYDEHGNRTKDERSTESDYNARDQLTKWVRKRRGTGAPTAQDPARTTEYTDIDGAGRPKEITETVKTPQPGVGTVTTTIDTTNVYEGDRLDRSSHVTTATPPDGANAVQTKSAQLDCYDYNVFGSQTQSYRQTDRTEASSPGGTAPAPSLASGCKDGDDWAGELETRSVFDTFERQTAGRQRDHDEDDGSDPGTLDGTQAFCFDPFDRRDRRVTGLTGAADPAGTGDQTDGQTRAQVACTTAAGDLGSGVAAFDYSYLGLTEQLTRENRDGRVQTYEYTASGERLGRLKITGTATPEWRSYDVDAQGSVVGLESPSTGDTDPSGSDLNTYDTDPYGAPVADEKDLSDEADANPFRFQGFYRDQETGTYDMQARTYRPELGQFLQQDRFADPQADLALASDPLTASRYAFTAGNPGTRAEYDGHCTNSAGTSIPGSPYSLAPGTSGPEIPCRLVPGYKPGPLATAQLPPVPISFAEAKANGFVLRQPTPAPAAAQGGKSVFGTLGALGGLVSGPAKAVAKGVSGAVDFIGTGLRCSSLTVAPELDADCRENRAQMDEGLRTADEVTTAVAVGTPLQGPVMGGKAAFRGILGLPQALADAIAGSKAVAPAARTERAARRGEDLTTVGRWMSKEEHDAMVRSGEVQIGGGGTTHVASPANATVYERQTAAGSYYVEFDVPAGSLYTGGAPGWAQIPSPFHILGRLGASRGTPVGSPVPATNIVHRATRLR